MTQVTCCYCGKAHPDALRATATLHGWRPFYDQGTWFWVCPDDTACAEQRGLLAKLTSEDETDETDTYTSLIKTYDDLSDGESGVLFGGSFYKDEQEPTRTIRIEVGDDLATDVLDERNLEKMRVQASIYSEGNIAQFILDVFNRYVDRFEADREIRLRKA